MAIWLKWALIVLTIGIGLAVIIAALRSRHPLRQVLSSGVQGLCALGFVNLLGGFTQVSLGISWLSVGTGFALGIPGVVSLLLLKLIFPVL
ncbi:MAG: pro-sigmaK processing inhibitor BofA family protein [Clostridia bacterium]|nr:pro-sigmaK processing inhibitor BofA family protein [Clostridia bacterium]